MVKVRKFMVVEKFEDKRPLKSMFQIEEEVLPALKNNQCLVKAEYISVDPYMRSFAREQDLPYKQFGFQVGKVLDSKNKEFPVNAYVVSHSGWCDYAVIDGTPDEMFNMKPYVPELGKLSPSLAVGALGMPGIAAALGMLEVCKPTPGDTVCVTSACGAVGSIAGQIARIKGCTVIGLTGSDQKAKILKEEFGFHHAINYKTEKDIVSRIKKATPRGVNCFFDNVGGALAEAVRECMAADSRVAVCGAISTYEKGSYTSRRSTSAHSVSMHIEAFSFTQWDWPRQSAALKQLYTWIVNGDIKVKQTVTNGFEKLPEAFIGMLNGENIGKAVVKV